MVPTLRHGDHALVWLAVGGRCRQGDVVIVELPSRPLSVKRVSACTDDTVEVAGDNPIGSTDSRDLGPLPRSAVRGRVIARLWPRPAVRGFRHHG